MEQSNKLTREQKEAVGLLSIGTFLEYFDLMLYVHMAVLLNELFFPKTDPFTASLLSAFAFCATFIFRPIGAIIFGTMGDVVGRKAVVTITTMLMAVSCITMASLPTYAQIGITASWVVTICRVIQGISSAAELVGAELYSYEITKPPSQYYIVSLIRVFCIVGANAALGFAFLVTTFGYNWRYAFYLGAMIALIGSYARSSLRETPEFVNAKKRMEQKATLNKIDKKTLNWNLLDSKKNQMPFLLLFFMECTWPIWFYFTYVYCSDILKNSIGLSANEIIRHNFFVSLFQFLCAAIFTYLCSIVHPLKLVKFRFVVFFPFVILIPFILKHTVTVNSIFFIQAFCVFWGATIYPAVSIVYRHLSVIRRFTVFSLVHALSRALMYIVTSFGMLYLTKYCGSYGLWIIMIPVMIVFRYGIVVLERLEKLSGHYPPPWRFVLKNYEQGQPRLT